MIKTRDVAANTELEEERYYVLVKIAKAAHTNNLFKVRACLSHSMFCRCVKVQTVTERQPSAGEMLQIARTATSWMTTSYGTLEFS